MADATVVELAEAVVRACVSAGRMTLPPELMSPVAELIGRVMVNPPLRDEFRAAVWVARQAAEQGQPAVREIFSVGQMGDISDAEIIPRGFSGLSPEQLAEIAADPYSVTAVADTLQEAEDAGTVGGWYWEAANREQLDNTPPAEIARRVA